MDLCASAVSARVSYCDRVGAAKSRTPFVPKCLLNTYAWMASWLVVVTVMLPYVFGAVPKVAKSLRSRSPENLGAIEKVFVEPGACANTELISTVKVTFWLLRLFILKMFCMFKNIL